MVDFRVNYSKSVIIILAKKRTIEDSIYIFDFKTGHLRNKWVFINEKGTIAQDFNF